MSRTKSMFIHPTNAIYCFSILKLLIIKRLILRIQHRSKAKCKALNNFILWKWPLFLSQGKQALPINLWWVPVFHLLTHTKCQQPAVPHAHGVHHTRTVAFFMQETLSLSFQSSSQLLWRNSLSLHSSSLLIQATFISSFCTWILHFSLLSKEIKDALKIFNNHCITYFKHCSDRQQGACKALLLQLATGCVNTCPMAAHNLL